MTFMLRPPKQFTQELMPACLKLLTKVAMTSAIQVHKKQSDLLKGALTVHPCANLCVSARSIQICKP